MTIHLSEGPGRFVRSLVGQGRYATEVEAVEDALRLLEREQAGRVAEADAPSDRAARQRENLERLCRTLDGMPAADPGDGLTNRDHDRILYGP